MNGIGMDRAMEIADRVEAFVRDIIIPYERDPRRDSHGPSDALVQEMRAKAREAGVLPVAAQICDFRLIDIRRIFNLTVFGTAKRRFESCSLSQPNPLGSAHFQWLMRSQRWKGVGPGSPRQDRI